MPQAFTRRAELCVKLMILAVPLSLPAAAALSALREASYQALGEPVVQPIPFSHKHHAGDDGIDCRYCHTGAESSPEAGLPPTSTCMTCHSQLYRDAPALAPLHESARSGVPIPWRRVNSLPDFVYFSHGVHVADGIACERCHGPVRQMPRAWRGERLQMQWCLDCHREADARESRRRLTDCSTCHR
jgi:hypothetical protein